MIEPALKAKEWAEAFASVGGLRGYDDCIGEDDATRAYCIAVNNAALSDTDRRKITREKIAALRFAASVGGSPHVDDLIETLESYLPPEKP